MGYVSKKGTEIDFESIHRILAKYGNCCISRVNAMKHLSEIKTFLYCYHDMQVELNVVGGTYTEYKFPYNATYILEEVR